MGPQSSFVRVGGLLRTTAESHTRGRLETREEYQKVKVKK